LVLFPTKTKGFSVGKKLKKIGNLASDTAELFFDECRLPLRYILGERDRGFYYIRRISRANGWWRHWAAGGYGQGLRLGDDYGHERTLSASRLGDSR